MDILYIVMSVPIVAIVMGVSSEMLKSWTKHEQEMARIRNTSRVDLGETANAQFEALRQELAQLRDTTTQYDMSVEHAMSELKQRVAQLETRARGEYKPASTVHEPSEPALPVEQRIGMTQ